MQIDALTALVLSGPSLESVEGDFSEARATDFGDVPIVYDYPV